MIALGGLIFEIGWGPGCGVGGPGGGFHNVNSSDFLNVFGRFLEDKLKQEKQ